MSDASGQSTARATGSVIARLLLSLQFRLVLGFAVVLAAALIAVGWYVSADANRRAAEIEQERVDIQAKRVEVALKAVLRPGGLGRGATLQERMSELAAMLGGRIVLHDASGELIADSHSGVGVSIVNIDTLHGQGFVVTRRLVALDGRPLGRITFIPDQPLPDAGGTVPLYAELASQVQWVLLWAGLIAGGVGIPLVAFLSRRALSPVRALSTAAERLGQGDLAQRVKLTTRDEIGRLAHSFNRMAEELERAERQQRGLMADIAHELRTPLSNIRGYVEAIRDGVVEPSAVTLDVLHGQVALLTRLVEDQHLLALAEAGALPLYVEPEQIAGLLRGVGEAFRVRAEAKGVVLRSEIAGELPPVAIDRGRTEQVLHNLVDNAVTHSFEGGVVTLGAAQVDGGYVRVWVADTGSGMEREVLEHIFERFYRADPSRARSTGGSGLGLTIAKQLVEAQGGRIWAESTPGAGSTFTFELPAAAEPPAPG